MNVQSAIAELRNPPRMRWLPLLLETGLMTGAGFALVRLFAG